MNLQNALKLPSMDFKKIKEFNREYLDRKLLEENVDPDPFKQFGIWFDEAAAANIDLPNAMTLATVNTQGQPSARMVLLKEVDDRGFLFYTNTASRKGQELSVNPKVALVFWWGVLDRQIRIEGQIEMLDRQKVEDYFHSRPYESQVAAILSQQSHEVVDRKFLEVKFEELKQKYSSKNHVPLSDDWGGYRVIPDTIEFWQGRLHRLHDRLVYRRGNLWSLTRLAP